MESYKVKSYSLGAHPIYDTTFEQELLPTFTQKTFLYSLWDEAVEWAGESWPTSAVIINHGVANATI